jgi:hypothetical protein
MAGRKKSYLNIYHGPIGGGKTASMTGDGIVDMVNGKRCFSNYKIEFRFYGKEYYSEPLNPEELLFIDRPEIKEKYTDCVILIDEGALLMAARNFQDATNRLISQSMLLRGKLDLSVYITVQYLSMFEKNMRLQEDNLIFCHDLSYRYPMFEPGEFISQSFQDISGRSKGYTYEETGRVYLQRFYGKLVWNCYDTKEMPVAVVRKKVSMNDVRNEMNDLNMKDTEYVNEGYNNEQVIVNLIKELDELEQGIASLGIIQSMANKRGFNGNKNDLMEILMSKGVTRGSNGLWNIKNSLVLA